CLTITVTVTIITPYKQILLRCKKWLVILKICKPLMHSPLKSVAARPQVQPKPLRSAWRKNVTGIVRRLIALVLLLIILHLVLLLYCRHLVRRLPRGLLRLLGLSRLFLWSDPLRFRRFYLPEGVRVSVTPVLYPGLPGLKHG